MWAVMGYYGGESCEIQWFWDTHKTLKNRFKGSSRDLKKGVRSNIALQTNTFSVFLWVYQTTAFHTTDMDFV